MTADSIPSSPSHTYYEFTVTTTFTWTPAELSSLRCTGSPDLEVDAQAYDGLNRSGGGLKAYSTNLPNWYPDTEFDDRNNPRVLTIGTTGVKNLIANKEYFTSVRITEYSPTNASVQMALDFQRGHWADYTVPIQAASCGLHGGSDPAWCVFASETKTLAGIMSPTPVVALMARYRDVSTSWWGWYRTSQIASTAQMNVGDRIYSPNGLNFLLMQGDGNLVEYIPGGRAVWASNTSVPGTVLKGQSDGNFVLIAPGNRAIWATGTNGHSGTVLQIQDDRNLVAYAPGHVAIWANNVAGQP